MKDPASKATALRRRANAQLKGRPLARPSQAAAHTDRLHHELEIYQIELEMQKEELLAAYTDSEAARERYSHLFDFAPAGYFSLSGDGSITLANLTGATLVGVPRPRLLGTHFQFLLTETDRSVFGSFLKAVLATGTPQSVELTLARAVQPPLVVHLEATRLAETADCRIVMLDISARRAAEERLRVSDAALKAVAHGVLVAGLDQRIISVNAAFEAITGYGQAEVLGRHCLFLQGPSPVPAIRRALAQRQDFVSEVLCHRKDGTSFWNQTTISPVCDRQGRPTRFVGVTRDITAQKQAQKLALEHEASREQLRNFARRLQVIREEERIGIARATHDTLGQELTALRLDLKWLTRRLARPVGEATRAEVLRKITAMTAQLDRTFESVVKLATDLRPVVLDTLGLSAAIEWLVDDFQTRTGVTGIARVARDLPPQNSAAATALFRIVQESLTNVTRHAEARRVEVTLVVEHGCLRLTVQDDGRGITRTQLADPRSIGLLGIKEHAMVLGGEAEIARAPGGGTVVRVFAPQAAKPDGKPIP